MNTLPLPAEMEPEPLCAFRASPSRAAGLPLMKTEPLPAATLPCELPQQVSRSVVTLPTTAAGIPFIKTSLEHPPLISPENCSGEWGGTWPECSPAVVPVTASPSLAALGMSNHLLTSICRQPPALIQIDHASLRGEVSIHGHVPVHGDGGSVHLDGAALDGQAGPIHIHDDGVLVIRLPSHGVGLCE